MKNYEPLWKKFSVLQAVSSLSLMQNSCDVDVSGLRAMNIAITRQQHFRGKHRCLRTMLPSVLPPTDCTIAPIESIKLIITEKVRAPFSLLLQNSLWREMKVSD